MKITFCTTRPSPPLPCPPIPPILFPLLPSPHLLFQPLVLLPFLTTRPTRTTAGPCDYLMAVRKVCPPEYTQLCGHSP